jgi:hypothetical protein
VADQLAKIEKNIKKGQKEGTISRAQPKPIPTTNTNTKPLKPSLQCSHTEPLKSTRQSLTMNKSTYGCPAQTFRWKSEKNGGYWDGIGKDKRILNPDGKYLVCATGRKTRSTDGYFSYFLSDKNINLCYHTSVG